ncbi:hypothetical protein WA158_004505 [Blastocystis sp. Blastoise]
MFGRLSNFKSVIPKRGLEEFVDTTRATSEKIVYGRAWKASELRRKSFEDLHKLWYVLLKERNVLLTERYDAQARNVQMSHPERLSRVNCSMARLKTVLSERQKIFNESQVKVQEEVQKISKGDLE